MAAKTISKARLEALTFSKLPFLDLLAEEREWYTDQEENVLGVLLWDKYDNDWGYVILGRDETALFRAIETNISIHQLDRARNELQLRLSYYMVTGDKIFPQGDRSILKKLKSLDR